MTTTDLGRDADGFRVRRHGGMDFRVSECCGKDATTEETGAPGEWEIVCRRCKGPVPEELGMPPVPPYTTPGPQNGGPAGSFTTKSPGPGRRRTA